MTLNNFLRDCYHRLSPVYTDSESRWLMRIILEHLKGWSLADIMLNGDREVTPELDSGVDGIIARLLKHEPIQYILGETYWHGLKLHVTPAVLIPRGETSQLVDMICDDNKADDLKVLDLCTGSGCIAIALALSLPFSQVTGVDISEQALDVARLNAADCRASVRFIESDILSVPVESYGRDYDIIVSNPPYIARAEMASMESNVLDYEPHPALFVPDDDPLEFYRRISAIGKVALKSGGRLYLEINPLFCNELCGMLRQDGWSDVSTHYDIHGKSRFVTALSPAS